MGEESGENSAVLPQSGHFPGKGRNVGAAPEAFPTRRFGSRLHSFRNTGDDGLRIHLSGIDQI